MNWRRIGAAIDALLEADTAIPDRGKHVGQNGAGPEQSYEKLRQEYEALKQQVAELQRRGANGKSDLTLTLEELRAEWPELVWDIEAPLRKAVDRATSERDRLLADRNERLKDEKLREIASQFPEPDKALPVLQEMCSECETDAQVAEKAFPVLLEALARSRTNGAPVMVEKPAREVLLEMFRPGGSGKPVIQETDIGKEINPALVGTDFAEV